MTLQENLARLPPVNGSELHLLAFRNLSTRSPSRDLIVRNAPGTCASFRIFRAAAAANNGTIDKQVAQGMLETFGEMVIRAKEEPGIHGNVDFLLQVVDEGNLRFVCRLDGEYF